MRTVTLGTLLLSFAGSGCTDLEEYQGDYEGTVVGTDGDSFIRRGFPAGTVLEIAGFDPPPTGESVGRVVARHGGEALLEGDLRLIAPLEHDPLSQYEFPGGGRIRNYIFAMTPTGGTVADREPMFFVSLMEDENLEVRVIAGSGEPGDLFGLFILEPR